MKNKLIFISTLILVSLTSGIGGFFAGRRSGKKSVTPVDFKGNLIIDHQEEPPVIYLEQLDKTVLTEKHPIYLNVKHYYKKSRK